MSEKENQHKCKNIKGMDCIYPYFDVCNDCEIEKMRLEIINQIRNRNDLEQEIERYKNENLELIKKNNKLTLECEELHQRLKCLARSSTEYNIELEKKVEELTKKLEDLKGA